MKAMGKGEKERKEMKESKDDDEKDMSSKSDTYQSYKTADIGLINGRQGKFGDISFDSDSENVPNEINLIKVILEMSHQIHKLANRVYDVEQVLSTWIKVQAEKEISDRNERENETEDTVVLKSRGSQCLPTDPEFVEHSDMLYADVLKRSSLPEYTESADKSQNDPGMHSKATTAADDMTSRSKTGSLRHTANEKKEEIKMTNQKTQKPNTAVSNLKHNNFSKEQYSKQRQNKDQLYDEDKSDRQGERVLILADSTFNGVQQARLGSSYSFDCTIRKCYKVENIQSELNDHVNENPCPTIIAIHCGINDLKTKSPQDVSNDYEKAAKAVKKVCPNAKVVVSAVVPVSKQDLNVKKDAFNALNRAKFIHSQGVSFVSYDHLDAQSWTYMSRDGIHPTKEGHRVLARTIGRHIHNLVWSVSKPRRLGARYQNSQRTSRRHFPINDEKWWHRDIGQSPISLRNRFSIISR